MTSELFKGRKESYGDSVAKVFKSDRLSETDFYKGLSKPKLDMLNALKSKVMPSSEQVMYSTLVDKYDRHGYKSRERILLVTNECVYGIDAESMSLRDRISNGLISGLSMSKYSDGLMVLHVRPFDKSAHVKDKKMSYKKGDLIVRDESNHIEFAMRLMKVLGKLDRDERTRFLKIVDEQTPSSGEYT